MNTKQPTQEQREQDERVSRSLELLGAFLQAAIADASILDDILDGAELIFEEDDPATRERIAEAAKRRGQPVALVNLIRLRAAAPR